jgi:hypothetical protein
LSCEGNFAGGKKGAEGFPQHPSAHAEGNNNPGRALLIRRTFLRSLTATSAERGVGETQGLFDGPFGADRFNPCLLQLLLREWTDHGRDYGPASLEGRDNGVELTMAKGMVRIEGAVLLDLNLIDSFRPALAVFVDQKTFGMAEVLIDFGA